MDSIIKSWLESDLELTVSGSIDEYAKPEKSELEKSFSAGGTIHSDGKFDRFLPSIVPKFWY